MAKPDGNPLHYVLGVSVSLAALDGIGSGHNRRTTQTEVAERVHFDTARRDLATRGFELVCQPTDPQTGWQLRVAGSLNVPLLALPLNPDATTPEAIIDSSFALRAGGDITEVARVRGEHTSHEILDSQGQLVCGVTDSVYASTVSAQTSVSARQWRTLTVTPTARATPALSARLDRRLRKAGAMPAAPQSELATMTDVEPAKRADVLGDYVKAQRTAMLSCDVRLRSAHDGVAGSWSLGESEETDIHDARVAVRRLRSTLRNFGAAFDAERPRELDVELVWYAGVLGRVRDQHVLLDRLLAALAEVPAELVLGPVAATISEHLLVKLSGHRRDLHEVLRSGRYLTMLDLLDALILDLGESKPLNARAIRTGLSKAEGRLSRRLTEACDQVGTPTADIASHTARKAAKRARYAAELATPVLNAKDARNTVKRLQRLQDTLGNHQDGVVAADLLRRLGAAAAQSGQNGFTFGLLYERELAALRTGPAPVGL